MSKGLLLVISGFSGAGKGTVMKRLLELHDEYSLSISATTRKPREGEADGREYFFKTVEEFEKMIAEDALIEHAQYVGNYYGTPKAYVEEQLDKGNNVILEIEIQGAMNIKRMFPDAVLMFITPPSAAELEKRLRGRGTEDEATIKARLSRAAEEAEGVEDEKTLEEIVLADKRKRTVHSAIAKLSEDMRVVIHLIYFEEMTYDEAAKVMKKNRKQVDNLLYRAKKELRIILGEDGELLL